MVVSLPSAARHEVGMTDSDVLPTERLAEAAI